MTWVLCATLALYLCLGAVFATALVLLDNVNGGAQYGFTHLLMWLLVCVLWLPWAVLKALRIALIFLAPRWLWTRLFQRN